VLGCLGAEFRSESAGGAVEGGLGGAGGVGLDSAGEELGQDGVVAGRQTELDLAFGADVVLGRAAGAGPPAAAAVLVAGLQQAIVDELVEVLRGQGAADADRAGGLLAAHGHPALGHVAVQGAAQRIAQPGEAGELLIDIGGLHGSILKQMILDG